MLDVVKRAQKARDAAERIMGYRIEEFNAKVSALIFADIKAHLQADIDWLAKVKRMSTAEQFTCVRATNNLNVTEVWAKPNGDSRRELEPLLNTTYGHHRGSFGNRTETDRAERFLTSPAFFDGLRTAPFTVPCKAFEGSRDVHYEVAVTKATREKVQKLRESEGKDLMEEYRKLVNMINDTLAACPTWAKLLVAWPDAANYLIELEPEPKVKALIVRNNGLEEQVKKFQPKRKSRSDA